MLLERWVKPDGVADPLRAGHASRNGDQVPPFLAALAARHRLDVTVRLDLHASAAGDGGAVVVLDAREHDLRAGTAQNVDDGDDFDLFRTIRDRYEDALRLRAGRWFRAGRWLR